MPDSPSPPADLDLRLVRYFTVVAEHLHYGRAAAALHIAQPSLSRQIRGLEQRLGVRLLDRDPQGSRLTEAGAAFLPGAKALLRLAEQTAAHARSVAEPRRITVGFTRGLIVTPVVRELRQRYPEADVRVLHLAWNEPPEALLAHRVDAVVTRLPLRADGLDVTVLHDEPRVLVVPLGHRLAGREYVTLDDISAEPLLRVSDPAWNAFWRIDPRPDGSRAPDGPLAEDFEDKFELVASGKALAVTAGTGGLGIRPDLAVVPLRGVEPSRVVLAARAGDRGRLVAAFRACALAHLTGAVGA